MLDFKAFLMDNEFLISFVYFVYLLFTNCLSKILEWYKFSNMSNSRKCTKWDPHGEICKICIMCKICRKTPKYAKYAYLCKCIFWPSLLISVKQVLRRLLPHLLPYLMSCSLHLVGPVSFMHVVVANSMLFVIVVSLPRLLDKYEIISFS